MLDFIGTQQQYMSLWRRFKDNKKLTHYRMEPFVLANRTQDLHVDTSHNMYTSKQGNVLMDTDSSLKVMKWSKI